MSRKSPEPPDLSALDPTNPVATAAILDALLASWREHEVLDALRLLAKASGGVGRIAERSGLHRTHLYKVLSPAGNPEMSTIGLVLKTLGLRLAILPAQLPRRVGPDD
jgi:probable addiction module antidote protein